MNNYIVPLIVLFIIFYGFMKKVNIYDSFLDGALDGLKLVVKIIPTMLAMILAVNIFIGSNILNDLFRSINSPVIPMVFLRPISGNASLAILNSIYKVWGPDSYYGILGSIIQGATDTTIYVLALYFNSIRIKKTRYALFVGLCADFFGILTAFIVANIFF